MVKFGKRGNERANDVLSGGEESVSGRRKASRRGAVVLAVTLFLVAFALVLAATGSTASPGRVCTSPSPWWIR